MLKELFYTCIDMFFPGRCPVCKNGTPEYPLLICRECNDILNTGAIPPNTYSRYIPEIFSCREYDKLIESCIKSLKYGGKQRMIHIFDEMLRKMHDKNAFFTCKADLVIPVPIHKKRYRKRGFNQAEMIARSLSAVISVPVLAHSLVKTRNTRPQTQLTGKQRLHNLRNSLSVLATPVIKEKTLIIVDDVMTTGTTLDTCAAELLRVGAGKVLGFTLARVM